MNETRWPWVTIAVIALGAALCVWGLSEDYKHTAPQIKTVDAISSCGWGPEVISCFVDFSDGDHGKVRDKAVYQDAKIIPEYRRQWLCTWAFEPVLQRWEWEGVPVRRQK